jgi:hypothetical protein
MYAPDAAVTSAKRAFAVAYDSLSAGLMIVLKATVDNEARSRDAESPFTHAPRITSG